MENPYVSLWLDMLEQASFLGIPQHVIVRFLWWVYTFPNGCPQNKMHMTNRAEITYIWSTAMKHLHLFCYSLGVSGKNWRWIWALCNTATKGCCAFLGWWNGRPPNLAVEPYRKIHFRVIGFLPPLPFLPSSLFKVQAYFWFTNFKACTAKGGRFGTVGGEPIKIHHDFLEKRSKQESISLSKEFGRVLQVHWEPTLVDSSQNVCQRMEQYQISLASFFVVVVSMCKCARESIWGETEGAEGGLTRDVWGGRGRGDYKALQC